MGRSAGLGLFVVACLAVVLAGCGEESEKFSDKKIADAAKVEDGAVGGDAFCKVDSYLNDTDEIKKAKDGKAEGSILASKEGNIGVVVVPPFPDDCAETVLAGLNKLDPKPKEE